MSSGLLVLGTLFTHHLVLQRGRENALWGWDRPGEVIEVNLVGEGVRQQRTTRVSAEGRFEVLLPALSAGGPYELSVKGSSTERLTDVWIGEVWLASGQSNMEWPLGFTDNADEEVARAEHPEIRVFQVPRTVASAPSERVPGSWAPLTPEVAANVTAVGYFFARRLAQELGVVVGVVQAAWGGTRVEAWTSPAALQTVLPLAHESARYELSQEALSLLTEQHAAKVAAWEHQQLPSDPGNRGEAEGWAAPELSEQDWLPLKVPGPWQMSGLRFNGVVWYRLTLDLPEAWAGATLTLSLGAIDDFDHTYFNGELVGSHPKGTPGAFQIRRRYTVPGRLVRAGRNVLAIRVFDHFGEGGLLGPAAELFAETHAASGGRLPLTHGYVARVEHEIPLVSGAVWSNYPATPEPLQRENAPAALYHGMIAPLLPFGLAGMLFYQGESNVDVHAQYRARFLAMIRDWRLRFAQGQLPFYFVQLASYTASDEWPRLREAQAEVLSEPATGMVCALDIGDRHDIHPRNKRAVGERLAALALCHAYGRVDVPAHGPSLDRVEVVEGRAVVHLKHAQGLHTADAEPARGFELCGPDGVFEPALAQIAGQQVRLTSPQVPRPAGVRYGFRDFLEVNLVNDAGLPAEPFRSDGR